MFNVVGPCLSLGLKFSVQGEAVPGVCVLHKGMTTDVPQSDTLGC